VCVCVRACVRACVCKGGMRLLFLGVRYLAPFVPNRCGLFHTISLREKWSSQLTWELCCSLRDQRCHQHHDYKQAPHLAPHYSYSTVRKGRKGTKVAYNADCQLCKEQIGLVCTTIHLSLTHPTTTAEVQNGMLLWLAVSFLLHPLARPYTSASARRCGSCSRINHRVSPLIPTWPS